MDEEAQFCMSNSAGIEGRTEAALYGFGGLSMIGRPKWACRTRSEDQMVATVTCHDLRIRICSEKAY